MKASVFGLGVEGKKALKSLYEHGWSVYATDSSLELNLLDLGIVDLDLTREIDSESDKDIISIKTNRIIIDLGFNDFDKLLDCDGILISPGLWNNPVSDCLKSSGKLISDVLLKHKSIFTIGVTGTNGKTTTVTMLKEILESAGKKVLVGGNAGGGFSGYLDLILKAEEHDTGFYDYMIVEVCDMTIDFCNYFFDIDLMALTNIGHDHMDVHGSIDNYKQAIKRIFKNKLVAINDEDKFYNEIVEDNGLKNANIKKFIKLIKYTHNNFNLKSFGKFNLLNANLAYSIADYLGIDKVIIKKTLENFTVPEGRLKVYDLNNSKIFIGKTDNSHSAKAILEEIYECFNKIDIVFIGTSRENETHRLDILNEVVKFNPSKIIVFKGLSDNFTSAINRIRELNYSGELITIKNNNNILNSILDLSNKYSTIFIGGNGQDTIKTIQQSIEDLK
ncbi:MAG: UDP-N-acetylmuramoylalanine--D-glutamate ligase [Methanobrevibacter sp.]|jgi:UDP-N-acetylmuramoylalanine--D-glutamate ligase|nr:UDP-N-acetylmuramoylalanine--D-glutamate ligase [Methanobrevibacter sp.]